MVFTIIFFNLKPREKNRNLAVNSNSTSASSINSNSKQNEQVNSQIVETKPTESKEQTSTQTTNSTNDKNEVVNNNTTTDSNKNEDNPNNPVVTQPGNSTNPTPQPITKPNQVVTKPSPVPTPQTKPVTKPITKPVTKPKLPVVDTKPEIGNRRIIYPQPKLFKTEAEADNWADKNFDYDKYDGYAVFSIEDYYYVAFYKYK